MGLASRGPVVYNLGPKSAKPSTVEVPQDPMGPTEVTKWALELWLHLLADRPGCLPQPFEMHSLFVGTPKIYTTTEFGPRKNREMAGVDDLVVYMQTAVKYSSLYIHFPGGAKCPRSW